MLNIHQGESLIRKLVRLCTFVLLEEKLWRWIFTNFRSSGSFFTPKEIVRSGKFDRFNAYQLATALQTLVREGVIEQYYRIIYPDGSLGQLNYDDPRHIPEFLDTGESTSGMDITPVFYL